MTLQTTMAKATDLDLSDIQGNVVRGYARYGFPFGRYVVYRVEKGQGAAGRAFLRGVLPLVTSAAERALAGARHAKVRPDVTTDVCLSYQGLRALGLPELSLRGFPEEFAAGMRSRCAVLGDDGPSGPAHWDPVWQGDPVHILIMLNGATRAAIERRYQELEKLVLDTAGGVVQLAGHRGDVDGEDLPYQDVSALFEGDEPTAKEHFGFVDGISNPYFKGCGAHPSNVIGGGKLIQQGMGSELTWAPLEPGEFLLGHRDESGELPVAPSPPLFAKNGTFMAYRKLHQNVRSFRSYLDQVGAEFPGGKEALAAKFAGRWRNGAPVATFPTESEANAAAELWSQAKRDVERAPNVQAKQAAYARLADLSEKMVAFTYNDDTTGARCPMGAHARRVNPRAGLEFGQKGAFDSPSALADRRRIIRRGLPYGTSPADTKDADNHGIIFMAIGASLLRQFEFVQQQWINYGNDFRLANEKDPLLGNHAVDAQGKPDGRMIVPAGRQRDDAPYFCSRMPRFVETRGGEYFFVPSLTALRMISQGIVDPT